ncbi:MAG: hemerythrin domain-containing protein [Betaproteobacteria bacterium]|nr:hemerythrin domain-containing protein [Betaproteobacteria bacterium]
MATISQFMTDNHHHCDDLFAAAENAAGDGDWAACAGQFRKFADAMEHHFGMEETVLFPAFEQQTGMTMGPTEVMRSEHAQMRGVLKRLADAVAQKNANAYLGNSETLLILMQQHNIKEESVLYPMTDQSLGSRSGELIGRMAEMSKAA